MVQNVVQNLKTPPVIIQFNQYLKYYYPPDRIPPSPPVYQYNSLKKYSPDIPHLYLRGKNFVFRLVIPVHLCSLAGKSEFEASLKTKDFSLALEKHGEVEPYYQNLMEKHRGSENLTSASDLSYEKLVRMAAMQGRTYNPIDQLIKKKPNDLMQTHSDWSNRGKLHYSGY